MKQVLVETNLLVDLLRPLPSPEATLLYARNGSDIAIHLPWVSLAEAKRTIENRIIREDIGFADNLHQVSMQLLRDHTLSTTDMTAIQKIVRRLKSDTTLMFQGVSQKLSPIAATITVIPPSQGVVDQTMALYPVKTLPPFDEMVLGAVLHQAAQLKASGHTDIFFCNKNTRDFAPTTSNQLGPLYAQHNIRYLNSFVVP